MGMNVGDEGGSGSKSAISDLNVTPLVDVLLVLLIIFMVTTPLAISGVNVQLPKSNLKSMAVDNQKAKEPLVISISQAGDFYLGKEKLQPSNMIMKLSKARTEDNEAQIFVRADRGVIYAKVMEAMSAAQVAGFTKIGMLGEATLPSTRK
jgi:biopolymer transport protein TolR